MRWAALTGLLVPLLFSFVPVHAERTSADFTLMLSRPVSGMVYGLYQDATCQEPLTDPNGENLVLTTDQNGKAEIRVPEQKFYLKQIRTVPGWYVEKRGIPVSTDTLEIEPHMISYTFLETSGQKKRASHLQLLNERKEVIADWKTSVSSQPYLADQKVELEAGRSYILKDPDVHQWETVQEIRFSVPLFYDPENTETIELNRRKYGRISLACKDSDGKNVRDFSAAFFQNEKGTEPAADIMDHIVHLHADQQGKISADLFPGTYYVRMTDLDTGYYLNHDLQVFTVEEGQISETEIPVKPVVVSLNMKDSQGRKVKGKLLLCNDGSEQEISASEVHLNRNHEYVLRAASYPAGYHVEKEISFHTPSEYEGTQEKSLNLIPFSVHLKITDGQTGQYLNGGTFEILNRDGQKVLNISSGNTKITELHDGTSCLIHCLSVPDGYLVPPDQTLNIGTQNDYVFTISCTPFVNFSVLATDTVNRQRVNNVSWTLYQDETCTDILTDIHGKEIVGTNEVSHLFNGTYYAKLKISDPHYYSDQEIYEIRTDHAETARYNLEVPLTPADIRIKVQNPKGQAVSDTEIEVQDANGQSRGVVHSSGDDSIRNANLKEAPLPGEVLYLKIRKAPGLHTWKEKRTRIELPLEKPDSVPVILFQLNPYVSLEVCEGNEKGKTEGSAYALFTDPECQKNAVDIHGRLAEKITDRDGRIQWDMREGTYWLKEVRTTSGAYLNEMPVKVILNPETGWYEKQNFATVKPVIRFITVDTKGVPVQGGSYEIIDENGRRIHTFQGGGTVELSGTWLRPGMTVVIHEKESVPGFQRHETDIRYTVPAAVPDKIPEIRIHYLRNAGSAAYPAQKRQRTTVKTTENRIIWTVTGSTVLIIGILVILKKLSNKNEKKLKNH